MVYEWKRGVGKADPQKVGEELEGIERRDARSVVEAARDESTELHKCFEWRDDVAAEKYREEQARFVLRMIVVRMDDHTDPQAEPIRVRAFESVNIDDGGNDDGMVYVPIQQVLETPDLRAQVFARIKDTIGEAEDTARKYEHLIPELSATRERLASVRASIN